MGGIVANRFINDGHEGEGLLLSVHLGNNFHLVHGQLYVGVRGVKLMGKDGQSARVLLVPDKLKGTGLISEHNQYPAVRWFMVMTARAVSAVIGSIVMTVLVFASKG